MEAWSSDLISGACPVVEDRLGSEADIRSKLLAVGVRSRLLAIEVRSRLLAVEVWLSQELG